MERWTGRVALVTGASAGLGAALAKTLASKGLKVVACARRIEKLQEMASECQGIYPYQCDMGKPKEIEEMFKWIETNKDLGKVDICINNAACVWAKGLMDMNLEEMQTMLNVNILSYNYATKLSVQSMMKHDIDDGQIIFINSEAAHNILPNPKVAYYSATKHALNCLLDGWRHELNALGKNIRIGQISPGVIKTAVVEALYGKEISDAFFDNTPHLKCEDVIDGVLHMLQAKPHIQTQDIILRHVHEAIAVDKNLLK